MMVGRGTKGRTTRAMPARKVSEEMFRVVGMRYVSSSVVKPVIVGMRAKSCAASSLVGKSATKTPSTTGSQGAVPVGRGESSRATERMTLNRDCAGAFCTHENTLVLVLHLAFYLMLAMIISSRSYLRTQCPQ